ncbi:hypothetical protein HQQ81_21010 [Microbacteriaceae bacterium VKM Ac-2854]|nr:hypothetical protein [Microbacteriaceae bacterium VKM Ac-2854]
MTTTSPAWTVPAIATAIAAPAAAVSTPVGDADDRWQPAKTARELEQLTDAFHLITTNVAGYSGSYWSAVNRLEAARRTAKGAARIARYSGPLPARELRTIADVHAGLQDVIVELEAAAYAPAQATLRAALLQDLADAAAAITALQPSATASTLTGAAA